MYTRVALWEYEEKLARGKSWDSYSCNAPQILRFTAGRNRAIDGERVSWRHDDGIREQQQHARWRKRGWNGRRRLAASVAGLPLRRAWCRVALPERPANDTGDEALVANQVRHCSLARQLNQLHNLLRSLSLWCLSARLERHPSASRPLTAHPLGTGEPRTSRDRAGRPTLSCRLFVRAC